MTRRISIIAVMALAGALMLGSSVLAQDRPEGVSPGAADRLSVVEGRCPAFSWVEVEAAVSYELVVYGLWDRPDDQGAVIFDLDRASELVYTVIPGGASSWTPSLDQCLVPGGHHVWFVRAIFDPDTDAASDWSEPLLFSIAAAPSMQEVEHALGVLERYREHGGGEPEFQAQPLSQSSRGQNGSGRASTAPTKIATRSVLTGTAAVRGEQPDLSGETYGVIGTSASPDGAGLGAANTGGGPDLVLDGSADGLADAEFSESGVDRPSATPQTFTFNNSLGGGISLEVDGVDVVTTMTDRDTLDGLGCSVAEVAKWSGNSWACEPDVDTNTDTMVDLGMNCNSGEIARWDGNVWICEEDRDTLAALSCGSPDRIAKWDGSNWSCAEDQVGSFTPGPGILIDGDRILLDPTAFSTRISRLDSTGLVGYYTSMAIGSDGLGLISYGDASNDDLKIAHCEDVLCTSATLATLDSVGNVGRSNSVAIGTDGLGLISYYDESNGDLKIAHCDDVLCSSATPATLDSAGNVGQYTSLAIGSDGVGLISYYDGDSSDLKVAHCDDVACTSATVSTVDSTGSVGSESSVAIGSDGLGLISYRDGIGDDLKVAHCDDVACTSATVSTLDTVGLLGRGSSVAIGADGLGLINYMDRTSPWTLKVAHCEDLLCSTAILSSLDRSGTADVGRSVTIGPDGLGLISYSHGIEGLKLAHCNNTRCTSATLSTVEKGNVGGYNSIAIGVDGLGLISYLDAITADLKVVHLPIGL